MCSVCSGTTESKSRCCNCPLWEGEKSTQLCFPHVIVVSVCLTPQDVFSAEFSSFTYSLSYDWRLLDQSQPPSLIQVHWEFSPRLVTSINISWMNKGVLLLLIWFVFNRKILLVFYFKACLWKILRRLDRGNHFAYLFWGSNMAKVVPWTCCVAEDTLSFYHSHFCLPNAGLISMHCYTGLKKPLKFRWLNLLASVSQVLGWQAYATRPGYQFSLTLLFLFPTKAWNVPSCFTS